MNQSESLEINNFCGIQKANINLAKYMLIIGPQSSGKSIISKLVYWSRMTISSAFYEVQEGSTYRDIVRNAKERFSEHFVADFSNNFVVKYKIGEVTILVSVSNRKSLKIEFSEAFSTLIGDFVKFVRQKSNEEKDEGPRRLSFIRRGERKYFNEAVAMITNDGSASRPPVYAPAARSFFSQIEDSLFVFLSSSKRLDPVVEGFGDYLSWAKETLTRDAGKNEANEFLEILYKKVLMGRYFREQKRDFIMHPDGRSIPTSSASSGQQEILPLCLILNNMVMDGSVVPRAFIIEEPEAHLHPSAQKVIVEAVVHAGSESNGRIILTTHSPYVLSIVNNLLLYGLLKSTDQNKFEEGGYADQLSFGSVILPGELSAYCLHAGKATSLIDKETGLIQAEAIDEVSKDLSTDFDALVDAIY